MDPPGGRKRAQRRHRPLPLPPVFSAIAAWHERPGVKTRDRLAGAIVRAARELGLEIGAFEASAPPIADLRMDLGAQNATASADLAGSDRSTVRGRFAFVGTAEAGEALARGVELGLMATQARAIADRATGQLAALDQAVRGISAVLDVDRVLQLIADRVRELVGAEYAAIGIVDRDGVIERFITSGMSSALRERIGDLPRGHGLLGLIIRENRSYRVPDINAHPERFGFPPHHPPMGSFLGMPITTSGAVVGRLYLTNKRDASEFNEDDQALVEMFALHAGIAIENARLHDQVRRLAIVDERDRISRDLHDSVIQAIYAQTLALEDVPDLMGEEPDEASRRVDTAIDALHAVIRDIRNFIFGLRPVLVEAGSLTDGLEHLGTELHRNGAVDVAVSVDDPDNGVDRLPLELVAELLAVTREALSNVARHAMASRVTITLSLDDRSLRLELADDGRGFDVAAQASSGHHGLANMAARIAALKGTFTTLSTPESGTRIIFAIPLRMRPDEDQHS